MAQRLADELANVSLFAFGVGRGADKVRVRSFFVSHPHPFLLRNVPPHAPCLATEAQLHHAIAGKL